MYVRNTVWERRRSGYDKKWSINICCFGLHLRLPCSRSVAMAFSPLVPVRTERLKRLSNWKATTACLLVQRASNSAEAQIGSMAKYGKAQVWWNVFATSCWILLNPIVFLCVIEKALTHKRLATSEYVFTKCNVRWLMMTQVLVKHRSSMVKCLCLGC